MLFISNVQSIIGKHTISLLADPAKDMHTKSLARNNYAAGSMEI